MSDSSQSIVKGVSTSRIHFRTSSKRINLEGPSRKTNISRNARSGSFNGRSSSNISDLLDPTYCYHPECSFAYNITKDEVTKPSFITECLPFPTYQRLAKLWNLDPEKTPLPFANRCKKKNLEEEDEKLEEFIKSVEKELGIRSDISEDLQVNACSETSSRSSALKLEPGTTKNPYLKFVRSMRNSKVKRGIKSKLGKEAGRITKKIIDNFLEWYQSLGGDDDETFIEESTLQELFQIGFDMPAAKALAIRVKELATVPECLAVLRNEPKHATSYALKRFLKEDIKLEKIPPKMFAFGRMLPLERPPLRFVPPKNNTQETWMECSRVPKDLDTMKTIWEGLEQLRSTIAFTNWIKNHSEIQPPAYLEEKGLLKINYEEWNQMYKGFEVDVGNLETVTSDLKIPGDKASFSELKSVESNSTKYASSTTF